MIDDPRRRRRRLGVGAALLVQREELPGRREHRHRPAAPESTPGSARPNGTSAACSSSSSYVAKLARATSSRPIDGQLVLELVERAGAVEREAADAGAAQRREVAADAQRGADVARERADVGAAGAHDPYVDVDDVTLSARSR